MSVLLGITNASFLVTEAIDWLSKRQPKERAAFQRFIDDKVAEAVESAAMLVNASLAEAAAEGQLANERLGLVIAADIQTAGKTLLGSLSAGYDRAVVRRAGGKEALQGMVVTGLERFFVETAGLGEEPPAFGGGRHGRNAILDRRRDTIRTSTLREADHYFAGYTAPAPQPFGERHPLLKDGILIGLSVLATKAVDLLAAGAPA